MFMLLSSDRDCDFEPEANCFLLSRSWALRCKTSSSGLIWYRADLRQALNKSNASGLSLVRASANILFVGIHLSVACVRRMLSPSMTMSMAARLSSRVGDDWELRWFYNDLQSVTSMVKRFPKLPHKLCGHLEPSKASERMRLVHSNMLDATDMLWASALNVEDTTRGNRKLFQYAGDHWQSLPRSTSLRATLTIKPA